MFTNHALIMIFGMVMPAAAGMANWMIPMMIGAPDMALPRLNNLSFWLLPAGATMLVLSIVAPWVGGGMAVTAGWTLYPPISLQAGMSMDLLIFTIHLLGISSILASINIVTTILNMRAPGMTMMKMPLFVWAWFFTGVLLILIMPAFAGGVTMLLFDRHFGTSFFDAAGGGDPVLFQHLFWFFGHPEVYVLLLPSIGVLGMVVPTFSRKPLFGYKSLIYGMAFLATLGMVVWAHHQYTVGMSIWATKYFMIGTILISIPIGLMKFNFIFTMWRGSLTFETPMLFAIAIILMFAFAGVTGVMLAVVPADLQYHDTYFVVAHFHYTFFPIAIIGLFAGIYHWFPKAVGRHLNETWGKIHFWGTIVSFNFVFIPMFFLGLGGQHRRIFDYRHFPDLAGEGFQDMRVIATIATCVLIAFQIPFVINFFHSIWKGKKAEQNPWKATTLEWSAASPPPHGNWKTLPTVYRGPYEYGSPDSEEDYLPQHIEPNT